MCRSSSSSPYRHGGRRAEITVLIADDHPRVLDCMRRLLEPQFEVVGAVADGSALVTAALELNPQVVVTDLVMQPISGLEAAAAILARCDPKPVIVLLTGIADHETAREALAVGMMGYVWKMRLIEDLIPAIEAALAGSRFVSELPLPASS